MQKRKFTRSNVWTNTDATIKVPDDMLHEKRQFLTVKGKVENLGANGMFLLTDERVPVPATAEITINFDTNSNLPDLLMTASGKTVRLSKNGVGIKFTAIDLSKLQKCIIHKINDSGNNGYGKTAAVFSQCIVDSISNETLRVSSQIV